MIADIRLVDVFRFGEGNLEHGDNSGVLESIKTFVEGLILINNSDIADFINLVEALYSVLDELCKVDCRLNCI